MQHASNSSLHRPQTLIYLITPFTSVVKNTGFITVTIKASHWFSSTAAEYFSQLRNQFRCKIKSNRLKNTETEVIKSESEGDRTIQHKIKISTIRLRQN